MNHGYIGGEFGKGDIITFLNMFLYEIFNSCIESIVASASKSSPHDSEL